MARPYADDHLSLSLIDFGTITYLPGMCTRPNCPRPMPTLRPLIARLKLRCLPVCLALT